MNELKDNNNIPPSSTQHFEMIDTLPSFDTPKGTKIYHPFLSHVMTNLDKQFTSPDMFNKNREYPHQDINTLSPDLVGTLFPKEINTNVEYQHQFEENLYKQYQNYFDKTSAKFFTENIIKPSPEPHDSGIGVSLQLTDPSCNDIENNFTAPVPLFQTPPSKFKWNREEYRSGHNNRSFIINGSEMSIEDNNHQSNQMFDQENNVCLTDNWSIRHQSIIGSPMFCDDHMTSSLIEQSHWTNYMRSSPHAKYNFLTMNNINLSPIKRITDDDMDTEEDI